MNSRLILCPPELVAFRRQRYLSDLEYRYECDAEIAAERADRIRIIFNPLFQARLNQYFNQLFALLFISATGTSRIFVNYFSLYPPPKFQPRRAVHNLLQKQLYFRLPL